jgi:hypothetical protein
VVKNGVTAKLKGQESMQFVAKSTVNVLEMKVREKNKIVRQKQELLTEISQGPEKRQQILKIMEKTTETPDCHKFF